MFPLPPLGSPSFRVRWLVLLGAGGGGIVLAACVPGDACLRRTDCPPRASCVAGRCVGRDASPEPAIFADGGGAGGLGGAATATAATGGAGGGMGAGGAGGCVACDACQPGGCCEEPCEGGCGCPEGCTCVRSCVGPACEPTCAPGSSCEVEVKAGASACLGASCTIACGTAPCAISCEAGAECTAACAGATCTCTASTCTFECTEPPCVFACEGESACVVDCHELPRNGPDCRFESCNDGAIQQLCPDGRTMTCNAPCP